MEIGILKLIEHTAISVAIIITALAVTNYTLERKKRNMINGSQLIKILNNRKTDLEKILTDSPTEVNYRIDAAIATIKKVIYIVEVLQREENND